MIAIENCYLNPKFKIGHTVASRWLSNIISVMLIVNTYFLIALKSENKEEFYMQFNPLNMNFDELDAFNTKLTWAILASILTTVVYIVAQFKVY